MDYRKRIERVERHIKANLDGDLSLDALAAVAAFSRFHFHRIYAQVAGESLAGTVRRMRMNRAAVALAHTPMPLAEVAAHCGYPNGQSFARAYRAAFSESPTETRRRRVAPVLLMPERQGERAMYEIEVREEPGFRGVAVAHRGAYQAIGKAYDELMQRCLKAGLKGRMGQLVAWYWDDPSEVPVEKLRAHAGVILPEGVAAPDGLEPIDVPPCTVAVLVHKGPYSGLPEAWAFIYGEGLPKLGRDPADEPPFERYLNTPLDTAPDDLLTEVVVPLA